MGRRFRTPTGLSLLDPITERHFQLYFAGKTDESLGTLPRNTNALHAIRRVTVPMVYRSSGELRYWREYIGLAQRKFIDAEHNPADVFDALRWHETFPIAYQMQNDRELMSTWGDYVCSVSAKCFPHLSEPNERRNSGPLRVGFISANLKHHNGAKWSLGWLHGLPEDIETYTFHLGEERDAYTQFFVDASHDSYWMKGPVGECAEKIKSLDLDVLIYTDIGMSGRTTQFASLRLARVQCTAWGHPVTSGLPTIDYYLSSDLMEPENGQDHYREHLVRLSGSGLCYPQYHTPSKPKTKADFGLPDVPILLGAQNVMKMLPEHDDLYLECQELGQLVFITTHLTDAARITKERMEKKGINAIWLDHVPRQDFLSLLGVADVNLDTPGWNGGNTTIESLVAGTPVVSLVGDCMRARHGRAFLTQAKFENCLTSTRSDYIQCLKTLLTEDKSQLDFSGVPNIFDDVEPVKDLVKFLRSL